MIILNATMEWGDILIASLTSVLIVFSSLAVLSLAFKLTGNLSVKSSKKRIEKRVDIPNDAIAPSDIPASEIAAIAMALHLFLDDVHDKESNVITIKRIERRYSPWNSKIYGLTNLNR
ncbi:hypothetical protein D0T49_04070 [Paludibacter sp. 221]|uniref:OadG family protein n=1 Tax=Paludibacter sp. 221 TaxID=2302939 RepID=UPI0013D5A5D6|nr:OadG family protein [Paludibacter sp. 221]NDV46217.1 hypothetical protein [Paludibacter sp. 221]